MKRSAILSALMALSVAVILSIAGCGGSGGGSTDQNTDNDNNPVQPDTRADLQVRTVSITPQALADAGINTSNFTITTFLSDAALTGNQADVDVADNSNGQIVFVNDQNGNPVAVAFFDQQTLAAGQAQITLHSIADGIIMLSPMMLGFSASDRLEILNVAKNNVNYSSLVTEIDKALVEEPENLLNPAIFPTVYQMAINLVQEAIDQINPMMTKQVRQVMAITMGASIIGTTDAPHLMDVSGAEVTVVNPTMVFYAYSFSGKSPVVIRGKDKAWSLFGGVEEPVTQNYSLGDGRFGLDFTKGGLEIEPAKNMANLGNGLKLAQIVLDLIFWCPISNNTIEDFVNKNALETIKGLGGDYLKDFPKELIKQTINLILDKDNWRIITKALYRSADDKQAVVKFLQNSKFVLEAGQTIFKALAVYDAATKTLPFFWDYVFKPFDVTMCVAQTGGVLEETCEELVPPEAVIQKVTEGEIYVDTAVTFDGYKSNDNMDPEANLQVRWDVNSDGNFETTWSYVKTFTATFSNVGVYDITLEVKDTDGLIGKAVYTLNVIANQAQGTANHIKVFRNRLPWDSNAFETMMTDFNYSSGPGKNQYEILPSSAMSTEIMTPGTDMIIIMNDQDQAFYDDLAASSQRLQRFIENGGVVLWEACDQGWGGGSMQAAGVGLPGGVTYTLFYDETNQVVNPTSSLMQGIPVNLTGYYASHEHFGNLPANAIVYTTDSQNLPTLIEFQLGNGWVIITGQPLEWGYDRLDSYNIGEIYPRLFNYVLGNIQTAATLQTVHAYRILSDTLRYRPSYE